MNHRGGAAQQRGGDDAIQIKHSGSNNLVNDPVFIWIPSSTASHFTPLTGGFLY